MNLSKLFETQKKLDERIVKEKGLTKNNLIEHKVFAFLVELMELANELPQTFKYWSNKEDNDEKALYEYVDGLHFLLSIGNELGKQDYDGEFGGGFAGTFNYTRAQFFTVIQNAMVLHHTDCYKELFDEYLYLGYKIGFTWDQIEQAYYDKNKINHERQDSNY